MTRLADLELVDLFKAGDQSAFAELVRRYMPLVENSIRSLYIRHGDRGDLRQAAVVGIWEAARNFRVHTEGGEGYDPARHFPTFVKRVVRRKLCSALVLDRRVKNRSMDGYVDLDSIGDLRASPPAETAWETSELWLAVAGTLTPFELAAVRGVAEGFSYEEVAAMVGRTTRAVDNALQRARAKGRLVLATT